ncbi:IQ domain-containing protein M isoform X3 [Tachyglossus aculeatus]|uniref:IQ domain-containing protein M isoform X3 n=1 Tax=Tachyglossus aculeatus TaxID=9261 RepID=UPI0018F31962|nr:IQ domain-containing protein M isoform X3 [Tachyglossus aculeatus]
MSLFTSFEVKAHYPSLSEKDQLRLRPCHFPRSISPKDFIWILHNSIVSVFPDPVLLGEVLAIIEPVSKEMEQEKNKQRGSTRISELISFSSTSPGLFPWSTTADVPWLKNRGISDQDGKEPISWKSFHSAYRGKYSSISPQSSVLMQLYDEIAKPKRENKPASKKKEKKPRHKSVFLKTDSKVKRIGPHIDIYEAFRSKKKIPSNKSATKAAVSIQRYVRGWLERIRLKRVKIKAIDHGPSLEAVIKSYRKMMHRIQRRSGILRPFTYISLLELEEWMDKKKYYETMFSKREFWQAMDRSELPKYFRDCGHFPTQQQLDDTWFLIHTNLNEATGDQIKKAKAVEMVFTLYPPTGAHVSSTWAPRSTWLRPIVDGEEGYDYLVKMLRRRVWTITKCKSTIV